MKKSFLFFPFYPFLFALFPILALYDFNKEHFFISAIFLPLVISVFLSLFLWLSLSFILRNLQKSGLIIFLFLFLFFSFGHFQLALKNVPSNILLALWAVIFVSGLIFSLKTRRPLNNLTAVFNLIALFLIFFPIVSIGLHEFNTLAFLSKQSKAKNQNTGLPVSKTLPDIYYLILDGYARADILKEMYQYDNAEFLDYLFTKGFYLADQAQSNYCQTVLSLASSLNFEYLDELTKKVNIETDVHQPLRQMIVNSKTTDFLKNQGYLTIAFSSGYWATEMENADFYLTPERFFFDEFQNTLITTTVLPAILGNQAKLAPLDIRRKRILNVFDELPNLSLRKEPLFVFAHIVSPHPPFLFDQDGKELFPKGGFTLEDGSDLIKMGVLTKEEYKSGYLNQLLFINQKVKVMINNLLQKSSKPSIIILQADHGPDSELSHESLDKTNLKERFSIFSAYYFPDKNYQSLYKEITPVNAFRLIFNQYFGTQYPLLKDKNYYSSWRYPYKFFDVTEKNNL